MGYVMVRHWRVEAVRHREYEAVTARAAPLPLGERGGIAVDDGLQTSGPDIYAIGEAAPHCGIALAETGEDLQAKPFHLAGVGGGSQLDSSSGIGDSPERCF